ncbi:hypothetical protein EBBID32_45250 [Sphingobium indicum BiD32]|uniref:Uncharacterized protein n=1 Tax=Sphingobium indicum BiD32 TaxID=1301087 RepID=N1MTS5_9SPHN|nr:hypothetical protein [Sphingobium indicum]CCW20154.1 hypothetical protein EBBID32_45250 [Sphingobium indicum BiD32]
MTLAGLSPAGALIVRAGEPFALQVGYVDEADALQDLTGRLFALAIRYTDQTVPILTIDAELDGLAVTAVALGTAEQASLIYAAGLARSLSYDFMELTGGATASRLTERVAVEPGSDIPGDVVPQYMDLPMLSVTVAAQRKLVVERGRPGFGAERRLYDAGLIDEPTVPKMDERYLQAGAEGARPFAEQAEAARDQALAAEAQTGQDRLHTSQDALATEARLEQAESAANRAELALGIVLLAAGGEPFLTIEEGELVTPNGQQFVAYGPENNWATRYLMVAGAGVAQDSYPNRTALDAAVADVSYQITRRAQLPAADGFERVLSDDIIWAAPGETSGPVAMRSGDFHARMPYSIGGPVLDDFWPHVESADEQGNALLAVHPDGYAYIPDTVPFLSDTLVYVVVSEDMAILVATTPEGGNDPDPEVVGEWSASERDGHIWVGATGTALVRISDTAGTNLTDPEIVGNSVRWTDFATGMGVTTSVDLSVTTEFGATITTVEHITASGQSLSRGSALSPPVTTGAPDPLRLMMFDQGVNASDTTALSAANFDTFASASVTASEPPVLSAGRAFLSDKASTVGVLVSCHGVGGYRYDQLCKGTVPYANQITAITTAARRETLAGRNYRMRYHEWTQGEADSGNAVGVYLGKQVEYQADLTTDYQEIVGTTDEVIIVTTQVSNFTAYSLTQAPPMTLELLESSILYPDKFICTGPKYHLPYVDSTHTTAEGSIHFGHCNGRAMRLHREGDWNGPLYVLSAVRTGDSVVLTFNAPYGGAPIDLNTSIVSDPGNYGVTFHQTGGAAVTVTGVAVTGDFEITVTLSATPTGTDQKIGIAATGTAGQPAGPTTGGRSCIRSAVAETDPEGRACDYYACHQFIAIS